MSYHEALVALMGCDLSAQRAAAAAMLPPPPGVLSRLLCMAPPELRPPLLREQLLQLLALARLPMDDGDETHVRLLGSVYAGLTGGSCGLGAWEPDLGGVEVQRQQGPWQVGRTMTSWKCRVRLSVRKQKGAGAQVTEGVWRASRDCVNRTFACWHARVGTSWDGTIGAFGARDWRSLN